MSRLSVGWRFCAASWKMHRTMTGSSRATSRRRCHRRLRTHEAPTSAASVARARDARDFASQSRTSLVVRAHGSRSGPIYVSELDDAHDEGEETLTLSSAS